jgi:hypothetical protein
MNWWEDENNLSNIEPIPCENESIEKCKRCHLIRRIVKTIFDVLTENKRNSLEIAHNIIKYWVTEMSRRYDLEGLIDFAHTFINILVNAHDSIIGLMEVDTIQSIERLVN